MEEEVERWRDEMIPTDEENAIAAQVAAPDYCINPYVVHHPVIVQGEEEEEDSNHGLIDIPEDQQDPNSDPENLLEEESDSDSQVSEDSEDPELSEIDKLFLKVKKSQRKLGVNIKFHEELYTKYQSEVMHNGETTPRAEALYGELVYIEEQISYLNDRTTALASQIHLITSTHLPKVAKDPQDLQMDLENGFQAPSSDKTSTIMEIQPSSTNCLKKDLIVKKMQVEVEKENISNSNKSSKISSEEGYDGCDESDESSLALISPALSFLHPQNDHTQDEFLSLLGLISQSELQFLLSQPKKVERRRRAVTANPKYISGFVESHQISSSKPKRKAPEKTTLMNELVIAAKKPKLNDLSSVRPNVALCYVCERAECNLNCSNCSTNFHGDCIKLTRSKARTPKTIKKCVKCVRTVKLDDLMRPSSSMSPSILSTDKSQRKRKPQGTSSNYAMSPLAKEQVEQETFVKQKMNKLLGSREIETGQGEQDKTQDLNLSRKKEMSKSREIVPSIIPPVAPKATKVPVAPKATKVPVAPKATKVSVAPKATKVSVAPKATKVPVAPKSIENAPSTIPLGRKERSSSSVYSRRRSLQGTKVVLSENKIIPVKKSNPAKSPPSPPLKDNKAPPSSIENRMEEEEKKPQILAKKTRQPRKQKDLSNEIKAPIPQPPRSEGVNIKGAVRKKPGPKPKIKEESNPIPERLRQIVLEMKTEKLMNKKVETGPTATITACPITAKSDESLSSGVENKDYSLPNTSIMKLKSSALKGVNKEEENGGMETLNGSEIQINTPSVENTRKKAQGAQKAVIQEAQRAVIQGAQAWKPRPRNSKKTLAGDPIMIGMSAAAKFVLERKEQRKAEKDKADLLNTNSEQDSSSGEEKAIQNQENTKAPNKSKNESEIVLIEIGASSSSSSSSPSSDSSSDSESSSVLLSPSGSIRLSPRGILSLNELGMLEDLEMEEIERDESTFPNYSVGVGVGVGVSLLPPTTLSMSCSAEEMIEEEEQELLSLPTNSPSSPRSFTTDEDAFTGQLQKGNNLPSPLDVIQSSSA